ncbi:MAG: amino acid ABC transporter substrate-binding protein [Alphaproteobacteria bacterium]
MFRRLNRAWSAHLVAAGLAAAASLVVLAPAAALAAEPITIGLGMALTGPLAGNGKAALLAMQIWVEDVNAKGGLLGRPVKLVFYDDQSSPSTVPGIYTKLLDVDKADLVVGGYATNMLAPAMPVVMQHKMVFIGLLGLAVNSEFKYPNYFSMTATGGADPKTSITTGFFELAMAQNPKPKTVAIVAADAEFSRNASDGARANAKAAGLEIVYDKSYPPATTDFSPIVRAIQATNPDLVLVASYPLDSVGMVRAANEIGLKTKLFGGAMVGLQTTSTKTQLGPLLNGIVNYDFWLPVKAMQFPGVLDFLKKYQAKAASEGVDPLGYYIPPWAYADLQVLGEAVEGTKSLDQAKLGAYMREHTFKTILGDVKFGANGELAQSRVIDIQYQHIKGNAIEQFKEMSTQVVLWPPASKSGDIIYPYTDAKN